MGVKHKPTNPHTNVGGVVEDILNHSTVLPLELTATNVDERTLLPESAVLGKGPKYMLLKSTAPMKRMMRCSLLCYIMIGPSPQNGRHP